MNLSDKILNLRKNAKMSQEDLAERLNVSRQAISRWEMGVALPDATNILNLSKIFGVTTDYLLNDDYKSDKDIPAVKEIQVSEKIRNEIIGLFSILIGLNFVNLAIQIWAQFFGQNDFISICCTIFTIIYIVQFEIFYRKNYTKTDNIIKYYKMFYNIVLWTSVYFPIRILCMMLSKLYPRPFLTIIVDMFALVFYILICIFAKRYIDKKADNEFVE